MTPSCAKGKNARISIGTPPFTPAASDPCNNLCNISWFTLLCLAAFIKACPCARNISAAEVIGDISITLVKAISDRGQKLGNAFFVAKVNRRLPLDRRSLYTLLLFPSLSVSCGWLSTINGVSNAKIRARSKQEPPTAPPLMRRASSSSSSNSSSSSF